jgi:hypothetical protein
MTQNTQTLTVKVGVYNCCGSPQLRSVPVADLEAAAKACRDYIEHEDVGNRDWCGGEVYDADGKCVAVVSYNGRVWAPGSKNPEGLHCAGTHEIAV